MKPLQLPLLYLFCFVKTNSAATVVGAAATVRSNTCIKPFSSGNSSICSSSSTNTNFDRDGDGADVKIIYISLAMCQHQLVLLGSDPICL